MQVKDVNGLLNLVYETKGLNITHSNRVSEILRFTRKSPLLTECVLEHVFDYMFRISTSDAKRYNWAEFVEILFYIALGVSDDRYVYNVPLNSRDILQLLDYRIILYKPLITREKRSSFHKRHDSGYTC